MGRSHRIEFEGATYHVIARGNNKECIFEEQKDKEYLLKLFKDIKQGMGFKVYAYVIMNNHYHFVIQIMDQPLYKIMHHIHNKYSKYYNNQYERVGHVFQGRYKALLIQDERYLLSVVRYVHHNPIKANICNKTDQYRWSSDIFYRKNLNDFADIDVVLNVLSTDRRQALGQYREYMAEEEDVNYDEGTAIGEEAYQLLLRPREQVMSKKRLDEILWDTGVSIEQYHDIKQRSRKRNLTVYKVKYIERAIALNYTQSEIGRNINISDAGVRDIINKHKIK